MVCARRSAGLDSARAWRLRELAGAACPVGAILSLDGVRDERAWQWRALHVARAPRPVLRTIIGLVDEPAWQLRERTLELCKEALDSIVGLGDERAWALRQRAQDRWPSTVVKSLGRELTQEPRGRELLVRQLSRYPTDLSLLRHAAAFTAPIELRQAAATG